MKVVFLNTYDTNGGAAIACQRLMSALQKRGVGVTLIVRDKATGNASVKTAGNSFLQKKMDFIRFAWERFCIFAANKFSRKNLFAVSIANTGIDVSAMKDVKEADIIHIHWINQGFLSVKDIQRLVETGKPIVWTMHDMWAYTGICHHSWGCLRFENECGNCCFLQAPSGNDYSHKTWRRKKRAYGNGKITPVAVSTWVGGQIEKSSLFRGANVTVIPNAIDTGTFVPTDKNEARKQLGLPADKKIILFSAVKINDPVKGFHYFVEAVNMLFRQHSRNDIHVILTGEVKNENAGNLPQLECPHQYLGLLGDKKEIARVNAAADVVVSSSLYETFGLTLIEAMSCGAIPVAFNGSGPKDIIDHKQNGYLAQYKSAEDLCSGIRWVLDEADYRQLSANARRKVTENYSEDVVAGQYLDTYTRLLTR